MNMIAKTRLPAVLHALVSLLVWGKPSYADTHAKRVHLHGTLINMTCWNDCSGGTATLLRAHAKSCLQMPDCIRSGYTIGTTDGTVYRMDPPSNENTTKRIAATLQDALARRCEGTCAGWIARGDENPTTEVKGLGRTRWRD